MVDGKKSVAADTSRLLEHQLKVADRAMARLARSQDGDDSLHDFRVAIRRIRSRLALHRDGAKGVRSLLRDLRKLSRTSDIARNAEVWLALLDTLGVGSTRQESEGVTQMRAQLARTADEEWACARAAAQCRYPDLRARMRVLASRLAEDDQAEYEGEVPRYRAQARHLWRDLDEALSIAWPEMESESAHRARLLAKRLRYLLESDESIYGQGACGDVIDALKALQTHFGEWRDAQLFGEWLTDAAASACGAQARDMMRAALREDVQGFAILRTHEALPGLVYLATQLSAHLAMLRGRLQDWYTGGEARALRQRLEALLTERDRPAAMDVGHSSGMSGGESR
ncbi:CHAD domain-containing protein [Acidihalobacter prosperus]|uniref:CHAD domain-containing protein n=1 Tax=Acidihalobacter prosperus TaxID=160660 RepID=A0A1A6C193_9GAMM|nr:CHAD domain-containing protein [Acidihalobacter prosperus]OBS08320.1 CHAD domain-containing protein [Acidihalobacter prosperus]